MIYKSTPTDGLIPHRESIYKVHNNLPLIPNLDELDPIHAGGYPMALLFAPRTAKGTIRSGYYGDHDIYFRDKAALHEAKLRLDKLIPSPISYTETENALTYVSTYTQPGGQHSSRRIKLQLIKMLIDEPQNIISKFDFVNCCVSFTPLQKNIYIHYDAIRSHAERTLRLLKPRILSIQDTYVDDDLILQLVRVKKYCLRWEYVIGDRLYHFLMNLYKEHPNLTIQSNRIYQGSFSPYEGVRYIAERNQNIWEAVAPILKAHPEWSTSNDPHGVIAGSRVQPEFNPVIELDEQDIIDRPRQDTTHQTLNNNQRGQDIDMPF